MLTRRDFLRVSALLGTGALLASCSPPLPDYADRETEALRRLLILYTNDEHGWMEPSDNYGGAAGLARLWRKVEDQAVGQPTLALSGGDLWTGPALSTYFDGESMIDVMNSLGYAAAAIGNHDFDDGLEVLRQRAAQANFPLLSANLRRKDNGAVPDFARAYSLRQVNGISVGLIGLTTNETPFDTQPAHVAEFDFIPYAEALEEVVPQVKAEGAQLLIVLAHLCSGDLRRLAPLAAELGIRILCGGHCHEETIENVDGVTIVQSGSFWHGYIRIALLYDTAAGQIVEMDTSLQPNTKSGRNAEIAAQVAAWREQADPSLWETIGYAKSKISWDTTQMSTLITRPWLAAYPSAQVALTAPRYVQSLPAGPISRASLLSMLPTDNQLVDMTLTGAQVVQVIEARHPHVGGLLETDGIYTLPDGSPLDPAAQLHVLIPNALYEGGNHYEVRQDDPQAHYTGLDWRTPIIDWVQALGTSKSSPLEEYLG